MICAVFGENRVTLRGHADYAPRGEDIVCAAASALVFALIGALEEKEQLRELVIKPGLVMVAAEGDCRAEWQVIRCGLGPLAGNYPACVRLEACAERVVAYHGKEQICRKHRSGWGS